MLLAKEDNTFYPNPCWLTFNLGRNSPVRIIVNNYSMINLSQHAMNLHGHNFWVVAEGLGECDGSVNFDNPMIRDTHILQPGAKGIDVGFLVIDFVLDNPGGLAAPLSPTSSSFRGWYVEAGLHVNLLERPDNVVEMDLPSDVYQTCKVWTGCQGTEIIPEIDSGA